MSTQPPAPGRAHPGAREAPPLQLVLREAAADDDAAIEAVVRAAFTGHPFSRQTEHLIVRALRAAGALTLSLVATQDGAVVGHLAFSGVTVDGTDSGWWGLGPLAVSPPRQRAGIGSALVRSGLRRMRERGVPGCAVLGDPAWYGRFGFAAQPGLVYPGAPAGHFLALALKGAVPRGAVAYHPAFSAAG